MNRFNRRQALAALSALGLGLPAAARAQDFPSQAIRLVVPYAPGGGADNAARRIALVMAETLKQTVLVDNRPGGLSAVAVNHVSAQPADGHTLLMTDPSQLVINPQIYKKLPYDPARFEPVALVHRFPFMLLVPANHPARTLKDFVAWAKARPAGISYGSAGPGTPLHLGMEVACAAMGIAAVHAPYKGTSPALNDLMGGQIDAVFADIPAALPYAQAGSLRPLAVSSRERHPLLPAAPTFVEAGYPQVQLEAWLGLVARRGTPEATVHKINAAVNAALADSRVAEWQRSTAAIAPAPPNTVQDFATLMQNDTRLWRQAARDLKISLDV